MLKLYRRHLANCKHAKKGNSYAKCSCPIWVDGMQDGKRIRYSLDEFNWEEASKRLLEINAKQEQKNPTISDAVTDYLKDCGRRKLKESGIKKYRELLNAVMRFCENRAIRNVRALDLPTLKKFVDTLEGDSTLVQGKKIEKLRTFFQYCQDMRWVDDNPARRIKKPKVKNTPVIPFTPEQMEALLKAIDEYPDQNSFGQDNRARMRAFVLIMRYTGLRISDAVKLKVSAVSDGRVFLHTTKPGEPVYLPLPQILLDALEAIKPESSPYYLCKKDGTAAVPSSWNKPFRRLLTLAKVEGHPHMFRHTMATELLSEGVPLETVAAILGNSPAIVMKHYAPWVKARQNALDTAVMKVWGSKK